MSKKTVYMCFSTDMVHSGHIEIIKKATKLKNLTINIWGEEKDGLYSKYTKGN